MSFVPRARDHSGHLECTITADERHISRPHPTTLIVLLVLCVLRSSCAGILTSSLTREAPKRPRILDRECTRQGRFAVRRVQRLVAIW